MKWEEFQLFFEKLTEVFVKYNQQLYLVGGSVRDHLFGIEPKDFDLATSAQPELTKEILECSSITTNTWPIGEKFGTIAAKLTNGQQIEVTTFRKDLTSGRHPDVTFTDNLIIDLERRDFTINSMAYSIDGEIIDPFSGQKDLENHIIRCTGDPFARFSEDPLRMLRAARFVSKLGFSLEKKTEQAIIELGNSILTISRERWLEEMDKLLIGKDVDIAIELLAHTHLLWFLLPEMLIVWKTSLEDKKGIKNLWHHIKIVLDKVPSQPDIRWAALLHDIAKPQTMGYKDGKVHFLGHDALGAEIVEGIARRFKMSNDRRKMIRGLVFLHQRVAAAVTKVDNGHSVNMRVLRRLVKECDERSCTIVNLIDLFGADCSSMKESKRNSVADQHRVLLEALNNMEKEDLLPKLPSGIGNLIMARFNLKPGSEVGVLRDKLNEMLLNGEIGANDSAESMLDRLREHK